MSKKLWCRRCKQYEMHDSASQLEVQKMKDIVERLRNLEPASDRYYMHDVCIRAADEIERLRVSWDRLNEIRKEQNVILECLRERLKGEEK